MSRAACPRRPQLGAQALDLARVAAAARRRQQRRGRRHTRLISTRRVAPHDAFGGEARRRCLRSRRARKWVRRPRRLSPPQTAPSSAWRAQQPVERAKFAQRLRLLCDGATGGGASFAAGRRRLGPRLRMEPAQLARQVAPPARGCPSGRTRAACRARRCKQLAGLLRLAVAGAWLAEAPPASAPPPGCAAAAWPSSA